MDAAQQIVMVFGLMILLLAGWAALMIALIRWQQRRRQQRPTLLPRLAPPATHDGRVRCVNVRHEAAIPSDVPQTPTPPPAVRRHPPIVVRAKTPLWIEKGWKRTSEGWNGEFQAAGRRWPGRIKRPYAGAYQTWMLNPPLRELEGHEHRPCFQRTTEAEPGWYFVHYHTMPQSLDHAITTVEAVLADALQARQRRDWRL